MSADPVMKLSVIFCNAGVKIHDTMSTDPVKELVIFCSAVGKARDTMLADPVR